MSGINSKNLCKKLASVVGVASASAFLSLPALALPDSSSSSMETGIVPATDSLYSQAPGSTADYGSNNQQNTGGSGTGGADTGVQQNPGGVDTGAQQNTGDTDTGVQQNTGDTDTGVQQNTGGVDTGVQQNTGGTDTTGGQSPAQGVRALW